MRVWCCVFEKKQMCDASLGLRLSLWCAVEVSLSQSLRLSLSLSLSLGLSLTLRCAAEVNLSQSLRLSLSLSLSLGLSLSLSLSFWRAGVVSSHGGGLGAAPKVCRAPT